MCADLYALSRYFDASSKPAMASSQALTLSETNQVKDKKDDAELDESELRLAQLQHQLPSNEPGALMRLVEDAAGEDEDDEETKECKTLFKDMKFFLSREVGFLINNFSSRLFLFVASTVVTYSEIISQQA